MALGKFLKIWFFRILATNLYSFGTTEDLPCQPRDVGIAGRSVVCVCNSTYCDTITREIPAPGTFVVYTSSNDGQRFNKSRGVIQTEFNMNIYEDDGYSEVETKDLFEDFFWNRVVFRIYTNVRYQYIEGFGAAVTDAAAINWRKLSDDTQTLMLKSYFSREGIEYNMIRVPIGGSDFSTRPYTYNETPQNDTRLSNFTLSHEDLFLKLPMIKRSERVSPHKIKIVATTWSPPVWMKSNRRITGYSHLLPEYYQTYADYHLRFLEEYEKAQVKIWAITTTNEPINGIVPLVTFNSLGWTPSELADWVANYLGPSVRKSRFNDTLILGIDDQRYIVPVWLIGMEKSNPKSIDYLDGVAVHYYGNFVPPDILSWIYKKYPNKIILPTEACEGSMPWQLEKVKIGSWQRASNYIYYILQDLNNYAVGWIDWNLCLDPKGGPNWARNFVDSAILVYGDKDEFVKQPMFYAMGHFSKFMPRGSRRISMMRRSLATISKVAMITSDGNIVIVLLNRRKSNISVKIRINSQKYISIIMEPLSVKTIEINPK